MIQQGCRLGIVFRGEGADFHGSSDIQDDVSDNGSREDNQEERS